MSRVTKWLRPARRTDDRKNYVEFEAPVQLYRIAHMTVAEPLMESPQVVDCRQLVDLGKDTVQAENCLAGLEFFFQAEAKGANRAGITAHLLHDPVTDAAWCLSYKYFDLACYASLEKAAEVEEALKRAQEWPRSPIFVAERGPTRSNPIVCEKESLCLLEVCQLGARCITRCPSIRAFGEEDTAAARLGTLA